MKTSYFFSDKLNIYEDLVSIAGQTPEEFRKKFSYRVYKDLIPPKQLVLDYKSKKISIQEYTRIYKEQLNKLDPFKVYEDLKGSIILCWEKPGSFCHRRLVADWVSYSTGAIIKELK
jgi:hypothetical protein